MSYDVYWVKNRAEKIADFEHPTRRDTDASVIRNFVPVFCNGRPVSYTHLDVYKRQERVSALLLKMLLPFMRNPHFPSCEVHCNLAFILKIGLTS